MTDSIWLQLLYKLPADSSSLRVYVWRHLRTLGGLYLQNSVCLLPDREGLRHALEHLRDEIEGRQGSANLLPIRFAEDAENGRMEEQFRKQSDEEYREFLGQCRGLHEELAHEREIGNLTFAELEENEMELGKIRSWLPKIQARDFFGAGLAEAARRALAECEGDFERFTGEVGEAQGVAGVGIRSTAKQPPAAQPKGNKRPKAARRKKDDGASR